MAAKKMKKYQKIIRVTAFLVLSIMVGVILNENSFAQSFPISECTHISTGDGNWTSASNWNTNPAPGRSQSGSNIICIDGNSITVNELEFSGTSQLRILNNGSLQVTGGNVDFEDNTSFIVINSSYIQDEGVGNTALNESTIYWENSLISSGDNLEIMNSNDVQIINSCVFAFQDFELEKSGTSGSPVRIINSLIFSGFSFTGNTEIEESIIEMENARFVVGQDGNFFKISKGEVNGSIFSLFGDEDIITDDTNGTVALNRWYADNMDDGAGLFDPLPARDSNSDFTLNQECDDTIETEDDISLILTQGPCWRTLTSPVAGDTYAGFLARFRTNDTDFGGLWTQGDGITGARSDDFGDPNVFTLNANGNDWVPVTDLTQPIPAGTGFLISVFDQDEYNNPASAGFDKIAVIADSEPENNPLTVNLGTLNGTTDASEGFSMLGNPFKTSIEFDLLNLDQVQEIAWIYDRNAGGTTNGNNGGWISWNGNSGDIEDGVITPGQGFVVRNNQSASNPSVEFPAGAKTSGGEFYGKEINRPDFVRMEIDGEELYNSMWLEFMETGSFDETTGDAMQLMPFESDYAIFSSRKNNGTLMDIGRFPSADTELNIPVIVEVTRAGTYTIRATNMQISAGAELYLKDLDTGISTPITENMEYTFTIRQAAKTRGNSCFTAPQQAKAATGNRFMVTTNPNISDSHNNLPQEFRLSQNYPNPFNPSTQIRFELPQQGDVNLAVYDMTGRLVVTLAEGTMQAGSHTVTFNAENLSSGVYIYRLQAGSTVLSRKLTLIK